MGRGGRGLPTLCMTWRESKWAHQWQGAVYLRLCKRPPKWRSGEPGCPVLGS